MKLYTIGIDVGGTNIKLGIVSPAGKVIARSSFATATFTSSKEKLINAITTHVEELITESKLARKQFAGVGIGLPGLIDHQRGIVRLLPNIPGWTNVALVRILKQKLKLPVLIDNDVKLITLAEWIYGAGRGASDMICLTLGTGVGSGLILNNALYRGAANAAGELGHMPLNEHGPACNCGGTACFERYIGNRPLMALANQKMGRTDMSIQEIARLADQGNPAALAFWDEVATHLGNGLVGIVNLLNPTRIVIGGGVSNNHRFLFKKASEIIAKRAMMTQRSMVKIVLSKLGDDAGIIGAHVLVAHARQK